MVQDGTIEPDHDEPDDPTRALEADLARAAERARDAELVRAALAGDDRAFGEIYDLWFDRVFNLVRRILRDDDSAAEVSQDAFLSAWRSLAKLDDPNAFGGWLLRIARNAAYNRSSREARSRPVDDRTMAVIEGSGASPISAPSGFGIETRLARAEDPEVALADGEVALLVRETVDSLGERDAEVLDLQMRYGLTPAEIGEVIGVNRNAANQLCHRVRSRFATAFGARMLWNGTRPACDKLDALLRSAGIDAFGAEAVKVADKHAKTCDTCEERRELRLQPSALFAALPLLAAPGLLKVKAASALAAEGVPMGGSASLGGSTAGGASPGTSGSASAGPGSSSPAGPSSGSSPAASTTAGSASVLAPGSTGGPADDGDTPVSSRKTLAVVGISILALLLLLGGVLVTRSGDGSDDVALVDGEPAADVVPGPGTTFEGETGSSGDVTDTSAVDPSGDTADSSIDLGTPSDPDPDDGEPTQDPSGDPAQPPAANPDPAAPAVITGFRLWPLTAQNRTFTLGAGSPSLTWSTSGATTVRVWEWVDGQPTRVIATGPSGSVEVCPGNLSGAVCTVPGNAELLASYVIEAVNPDGVVTWSNRTVRPTFTVNPLPG